MTKRHVSHRSRAHTLVRSASAGWTAAKGFTKGLKRVASNFKSKSPLAKKQKTKHVSKVNKTIQSPPCGLSKSFTKGPRGKGKINNKTHPSSYFDQFTCYTASSTPQLQGITMTANTGSGDILANIAKTNTSLLAGNIGALSTAGFSGYNVFVKSLSIETTFTNEAGCVADLCIYDLIARIDGADPAPDVIFTSGPSTLQGVTTGVNGKWPFAVPQHYPQFMKNYIIQKRTPVELSPGRSHKHVFHYPVMRSFPFLRLNDQSVVGKLHIFTILVWKGMPLSDTLGGGGSTDVSLCPIKLVYSGRTINHAVLMDIIPKFERTGANNFIAAPVNQYYRDDTSVIRDAAAVLAAVNGGPA